MIEQEEEIPPEDADLYDEDSEAQDEDLIFEED
jgi:hypothetical protein